MTVVNLNKVRKAKNRNDRQLKADENAVKFGRSKAQKKLEKALDDKANQQLDGKERE